MQYAGELHWSWDSCWLATVNDVAPQAVWVWDVTRLCLNSVIVFQSGVHTLQWHPSLPQLVMATNCPCLYVWRPEVCIHASFVEATHAFIIPAAPLTGCNMVVERSTIHAPI